MELNHKYPIQRLGNAPAASIDTKKAKTSTQPPQEPGKDYLVDGSLHYP